jgi:hypothetical protein
MRLERYADADSVLADLSSVNRWTPSEDAAFDSRKSAKRRRTTDAVSVYESLVLKKLAQPQIAWLRLGLVADLGAADAIGRGLAARVLRLSDVDRSGPGWPRAGQAGRRPRAPFAPKELARARGSVQARRWTGAKRSYDRVKHS